MRNVLALVLAVLLPACGSFDPKPDPSRFFTLSPLFQSELDAAKTPGSVLGISLGVGPVTLPGYLDREEIVVRIAQNRLRLLEHDRWAEPLEENIARVVSQNIAHLVRAERIHVYPWPIDRKPVYQVEIDVLRFEPDGDHQAQLSTRWVVRNTSRKDRIRYRETRLSRPVPIGSTEASVAALSETLAELSREVAAAIQDMDGTKN
jgi:uncharacterized lipoprotein YmbA